MRTVKLPGTASGQRGLTLLIVLIALVSMSLAAVALIRSVDTGSLVLGNLAFKQGTTSATDSSVETAMTWLSTKLGGDPTALYKDDATTAYYATSLDDLDISGHSASSTSVLVDWNDDNCDYASVDPARCLEASPAVTANGYTTRYVITRLCKTTGDPNETGQNCAKPTTGVVSNRQINTGETKVGATTSLGGSSTGATSGSTVQIFRIVVRSKGPRNTVSYTETFISAVGS